VGRILAVYISGHGYGHLAQVAPVLVALLRRHPDVRLLLRTELDEAIIRRFLPLPFRLLSGSVDVGVIQRHAVLEDIPATIAAAQRFFATWDARIAAEVRLMRGHHPSMVLSDISPLAFPLARRLGVPAVALGTLDWHAVYSAFMADDSVLALLAAAHEQADVLLQPPLSMPMTSFPRIRPIGLIVRRASISRRRLRQCLNIADGDRLGMVMFGGSGNPPFDTRRLDDISGWQFGIPATDGRRITPRLTHAPCGNGITTADYVAAADVVICKPSYNILAECWRHQTPIVYVPRPDFPEYPYLHVWLEGQASAVEIGLEAFASGEWGTALERAVHTTRTWPETDMHGGSQAAEYLAGYLRGS